MLKNFQDSTFETDFGVKSVDDSSVFSSSLGLSKRHSMIATSQLILKDGTNHFRMIVCGDSGIGKSALVQALSTLSVNQSTSSLEPSESFVPSTDTCIVDTCGYGATVRPDIIFSKTKSYLEKQFEKTNSLFHPSCRDDQRLVYMVEQASAILTHVDVCLYLIMGRLKPVDIEYMRCMHELVNIVPVMIQPDLSVRMDQMIEHRLDIIHILYQNQIKFCTFGYTQDEIIEYCKQASAYCVPFVLNWSSTKPLFHGLTHLKQALFNTHLIHLRKQTTHKFIQWRRQQVLSMNNTSSSISSSISTSSSVYSLSSAEKQKVSEYVSKRRHQLEKELLKQDKELKQEFERRSKKSKRDYLLKEFGSIEKQERQANYNLVVTS
ncbi:hypothetical protein RO3G_12633 [Rhizopus delemar RA 99-880]|uniref:Septin-type G domain-containing protein n=1 Tax=Rhizopus delemar (strain RA 99-880 / ATCC MYA-4621 / FGSC 9543 / NRRL 43880) TaxID=246409 RepID=I1CHJ2_RHIO9|nr:hypothetical protein RO3G_12633 [Rhizopus delemar RA 99-880]|eukprot:EIE87922.1 hypothetical protein RO3G_12633 [Rhizopus delemar RA 99-880]